MPEYEVVGPDASAVTESLRAVGYNVQTAVADLVDNSISASASNVRITFHWAGAESYVAISDDGHGMTETDLVDAMRIGSKNPLESRSDADLGRYGLGLKTASFSQCRRLSVCTRRNGVTSVRAWDLDYVADTSEWRLLKALPRATMTRLESLSAAGEGTTVLWERPDRLVGTSGLGDAVAHRRFLEQVRQVDEHLSMVFHRFLEGPRAIRMYVNSARVSPWDPFLTAHPATQHLAEESFPIAGKRVIIRPYVLPHHSKLTSTMHKNTAGPRGWNAQQGFYVYRNRRLLVGGDWLRLGFQKEEHCKLARIQVDIPNTADDAWALDIKKSTARPPASLRDDFRRIATATRAKASQVYRHRGKVLARQAAQDHVFVWQRVITRGKVSYRINRMHPAIRGLVGGDSSKAVVEEVLRLIEETVPTPLIALDTSERPDDHAAPFEVGGTAELGAVAKRLCEAFIRNGSSEADARQQLLTIEPFSSFPEVIEALSIGHE